MSNFNQQSVFSTFYLVVGFTGFYFNTYIECMFQQVNPSKQYPVDPLVDIFMSK